MVLNLPLPWKNDVVFERNSVTITGDDVDAKIRLRCNYNCNYTWLQTDYALTYSERVRHATVINPLYNVTPLYADKRAMPI